MASTTVGEARLTAKTTRNEPTPAMKRFTMYQNLLRGGASSECSKICFRQLAGTRNALDPANVPNVKNTYPVMEYVSLNTIFCKTYAIPNAAEAIRIFGCNFINGCFSAKNIMQPPRVIITN